MRQAWMLLFLAMGCPSKDTGSADDSDTNTDDTSGGDDTDSACATGHGEVDGVLLGSDGVPLDAGKVELFDDTGSEKLVSDDVDSDGNYHLVYGKGDYVVRGTYSTCVSEDIPVTICGGRIELQNINLTCAP